MRNRAIETVKDAGAFSGKKTSRYKSAALDEHIIYSSWDTGEDKVGFKKAEEALLDCREFYRILLENTLNQVMVIGPDTAVRYINPSFEKMTGFSSDEIIGLKAPYPWWPESTTEYFGTLSVRNSNAIGESVETLFKKKNGEAYWVEISITSVKQDGVVNYLLVNCVDITERRLMKEKLIMQDRLVSIGHLSSGLAHEINNPLTSVITFSSLLLNRELPDDIKEDLKMINEEALRAAGIVKNLLSFVRKQPQEKQLVNINEGIQKALELRAYEQKVKNITVNERLAPELPWVLGDNSRLQQVFTNIIINAEYFMYESHRKGTLTIKTEKVGNFIRASFADDGPGISKVDMSHLFDPFFTTKKVGKGTGLGLSICRGIINEYNGRIWAESKPGKGTVFIIELPVNLPDVHVTDAKRENTGGLS